MNSSATFSIVRAIWPKSPDSQVAFCLGHGGLIILGFEGRQNLAGLDELVVIHHYFSHPPRHPGRDVREDEVIPSEERDEAVAGGEVDADGGGADAGPTCSGWN